MDLKTSKKLKGGMLYTTTLNFRLRLQTRKIVKHFRVLLLNHKSYNIITVFLSQIKEASSSNSKTKSLLKEIKT